MVIPTGFKIISGGQSGADRAALDAALEAGIPCDGWCPADRAAEDGPIDPRYPLTPAPGAGYRERTRLNVRDSDGTVIFTLGELRGGSLGTVEDCQALKKPYLVIDGKETEAQEARQLLGQFIGEGAIRVLNVAGPRASDAPGIFDYVREVLAPLLKEK
ncbi:MAG TPA: putative molybdenum carrier protein [Tepidisphaeraceae bacterium]|jgi:predicted Rossmann-fold nucleotide-binding protein|nr:putative molybdenum carrier protein [Tepidisphaeraceae bacterium]